MAFECELVRWHPVLEVFIYSNLMLPDSLEECTIEMFVPVVAPALSLEPYLAGLVI